MSRGGARPGAGRKKGVPNRKTAEVLERASAKGELPLDYMLRTMRDGSVDPRRRDEMAKAAAPYLHSKLVAKETLDFPSRRDEPGKSGWEGLLDWPERPAKCLP